MGEANLGEDTVYNAVCEGVVAVSQQILFCHEKVVVGVELPELYSINSSDASGDLSVLLQCTSVQAAGKHSAEP